MRVCTASRLNIANALATDAASLELLALDADAADVANVADVADVAGVAAAADAMDAPIVATAITPLAILCTDGTSLDTLDCLKVMEPARRRALIHASDRSNSFLVINLYLYLIHIRSSYLANEMLARALRATSNRIRSFPQVEFFELASRERRDDALASASVAERVDTPRVRGSQTRVVDQFDHGVEDRL